MLIVPTRITFAIYVIVATITTILLCGVSTIYNRKTLDTRIEGRKNRLKELEIWLKNDMGLKDEKGIEQLRNRMQTEIDERCKSINKVEDILLRIFQFICFPIILAVFTRFLQLSDTDFSETVVTGAVTLVIILLIAAAFLFFVYTVITSVIKNEQLNYEMFTDDLQDVLFYQSKNENEDTVKTN